MWAGVGVAAGLGTGGVAGAAQPIKIKETAIVATNIITQEPFILPPFSK